MYFTKIFICLNTSDEDSDAGLNFAPEEPRRDVVSENENQAKRQIASGPLMLGDRCMKNN